MPSAAWTLLMLCILSIPLLWRGDFILFLATQAGVMMLVSIGLNFLTGYAGQVSLGHGGLVAIGAYVTALLMMDYQVSFWVAGFAGMVVACLAGLVMALPALRLSTWYFALVTLTFSQVVSDLLVEWRSLTHGFSGIVGIPAPSLGSYHFGPGALYITVVISVAIAFILTKNIIDSRFGRGMVAARDNPLAATASGVSLLRIKLFAFAVSAALAGLAGAFFAVQKTVITPEDFGADFSIFFLLIIVVGGLGRLWGPVVGTLVFFLLPELLGSLQSWRFLVYGVALLVLMLSAPHGIMGMAFWRRWQAKPLVLPADPASGTAAIAPLHRVALSVKSLRKHFGGVQALDGCALEVAAGGTHALVGPNGSGKTTTLNVISGFIRADEGGVMIGHTDVLRRSPDAIARLGVGRTFQTPKLLGDMTVLDNVCLGSFGSETASVVEIALNLPRAERDRYQSRTTAMNLLRFVGLAERACDHAGELPHGQQRLVEIARALAGRPGLMLLDEPAAGLSMDELDKLATLIKTISGSGTTVLIVEHHLDLIAKISDRVTVLDRGKVLAVGTAADVFAHSEVVRAYMGTEGTGGTR
jgi:branched-chain amino acid transport system permease protein